MNPSEAGGEDIDHLPDPAQENALVRKITLRLLPFLFLLYVVAYVDRVNAGFAKPHMNHLPWFSEKVFGFGSGIFFFGYFLFEVPSNLILQRVGARRWIMRIMLSWGVIAMAMFLVQSAPSFYIFRFLLGLAEAGFFPGVLLYLTYWYTAKERARVVATLMTANAVSFIVGGPVSGWLASQPPRFGLEGWQQLFILEGLPAVALGFVVLYYLPDNPTKARWLTEEEKTHALARVRHDYALTHGTSSSESGEDEDHSSLKGALDAVKKAIGTRGILHMCLMYFGISGSTYGTGLWLPQIITNFGHLSGLQVGLLSAVPYCISGTAMVLNGIHSDRTGERRWHVAIPAFCGALGLVGCAFLTSPVLSLASLSLAASGMASVVGPFWSLPPKVLKGPAVVAGGLALINSLGNLGGFFGPFIVGWLKDSTHAFAPGLCFLASLIAMTGILALATKRYKLAPDR